MAEAFDNLDSIELHFVKLEANVDRFTGFALEVEDLIASERGILLDAVDKSVKYSPLSIGSASRRSIRFAKKDKRFWRRSAA